MKTNNQSFEPRIVGFLCNWCAYSGADLAGVSRLPSSPHLRILRVMCSGRVDPSFILRAFQLGADAVLIAGCHPGDCPYQEGNFKAWRRVLLLKRILRDFGIDERRLRLEWISASEAEKLSESPASTSLNVPGVSANANACPSLPIWPPIGSASTGASFTLSTSSRKRSETDSPAVSVALTEISSEPTSSFDGVPSKVALVALVLGGEHGRLVLAGLHGAAARALSAVVSACWARAAPAGPRSRSRPPAPAACWAAPV